MIDTHCHIYLPDFDADRDAMLQRAADAGVTKFFLPGIDGSCVNSMLKAEQDYPGKCFAMPGLHPCHANEDTVKELASLESVLKSRKFAAIGETGLDFYWDKTHLKQQYHAFHQQIEWAILYDTPIVLHTRDATQECIDVISEYKGRGLRGIFHCFGNGMKEAEQIIELGFLMGIGGVVTYKNAGLAPVVAQIDLRHIVLETDAPYLTPVPHRGKRNEPSYLKFVVEKIAEAKGISVGEVDRITTENAERLFAEK